SLIILNNPNANAFNLIPNEIAPHPIRSAELTTKPSPQQGEGEGRVLLFNRNCPLLAAFDIKPYSKCNELSRRS
ncbi:MAG: hypothetical protein Q8N70_09700, partial [Deltaproteobacteria bacterium]|nr:hypothetical protein [Deltaproteobacteria bacterium]